MTRTFPQDLPRDVEARCYNAGYKAGLNPAVSWDRWPKRYNATMSWRWRQGWLDARDTMHAAGLMP